MVKNLVVEQILQVCESNGMPYNGQIEARKNRSAIDAAVLLVPKAQEV